MFINENTIVRLKTDTIVTFQSKFPDEKWKPNRRESGEYCVLGFNAISWFRN